ncbi:MAG: DUF2569 family protein [Nanoarchaeota archaeon]
MAKQEVKKKLAGIGGWLGLFQYLSIGLLIGIGGILTSIFFVGLRGATILVTILTVAVFVFILINIILVEKKRLSAPRRIISFLWIICIISVSIVFLQPSLFVSEGVDETAYTVISSLVITIIWTLYFLKSTRVKNTFVK